MYRNSFWEGLLCLPIVKFLSVINANIQHFAKSRALNIAYYVSPEKITNKTKTSRSIELTLAERCARSKLLFGYRWLYKRFDHLRWFSVIDFSYMISYQ